MPNISISHTTPSALLTLHAVRKSHNVGTPLESEILHGINLKIHNGEFCALIGPSGSGKTTLLNLIGLLEQPTSGKIYLNGTETSQLSEAARTRLRGKSVGFIFQFHHLLPAFTALENVIMPAHISSHYDDDAYQQRAKELLSRVGLNTQMHKKPSQLSGGQQQRVAIARALLLNPLILLADEPTGNLDSKTASDVFALLREFNQNETKAHQHCCLIVTHDERLAKSCDRQIVIQDGLIQTA